MKLVASFRLGINFSTDFKLDFENGMESSEFTQLAEVKCKVWHS